MVNLECVLNSGAFVIGRIEGEKLFFPTTLCRISI